MDRLISLQAAIDVLHMDTSIIPYKKAREYADATILEIRNRLEDLPSAQPDLCDGCDRYGASCVGEGCGKLEMPEIIRCRDCISYQEGIDIDGKPFTRCNGSVRTYGHTLPDWYCADAERRTDGTEQP